MSFTKLLTMYAVFSAAFKSFKALHRSQRYSKLIDEHNALHPDDYIDEDAVIRALDKREVLPLLHFWTCFAFIQLFDIYVEGLLSWVPFYGIVKLIILGWIIAPQTRGATVFFENFLAPQFSKRMEFIEDTVFPLCRKAALTAVIRIHRLTMNFGLESISNAELNATDQTFDKLLRAVTREGYLRRREESILALKTAVPEEKHRISLLDDILKEYKPVSNDFSDWTEVRLAADKGALRIRFDSEFEDQEERDDFTENEEATIDDVA